MADKGLWPIKIDGRWKLPLIVGVLCVPILMLAGIFATLSLKTIDFSSREMLGTASLRPAWSTLSAIYAGSETAGYGRNDPQALIYDDQLGLRNDRAALTRAFVGGPGSDHPPARPLSSRMRAFIKRIADASNLTLDTQIDTYYLMNAAVNVLPDVGDHSGAILARFTQAAQAGHVSEPEKGDIATEIALLAIARQNTDESLALAMRGDTTGTVKAAIAPALSEFDRTADLYIARARVLATQVGGNRPLTAVQIQALTPYHEALATATDRLWQVSVGDLDRLLGRRVNAGKVRLWWLLALSVAISAAALGLVVYLDLHVQRDDILRLNSTLRQSNEELERFAFICSHDLQEPVRMMNIYAELLEDTSAGQLDGEAREYLGLIRDNAVRMRNMIRDVLDFSRIGREAIQIEAVDMNKALKDVLSEFEATIEEKAATVTCGELPTLATNPTLVRVLFQNLISNALKFNDGSRAPEIVIAAERQGGDWRFNIRDNGIGMDAAFHHKIFMIFQRLNPNEDYPGTGIGLSSCRKFIRMCGGDIHFTSVFGEGSDFAFTLPATETAKP